MICFYTTKHGATKYIIDKIFEDHKNVRIKEISFDEPPEIEDDVFLAFPIYYVAAHRKAERFIRENINLLLTKNVTLAVIGMMPKLYKDVDVYSILDSKGKEELAFNVKGTINKDLIDRSKVILIEGNLNREKLNKYELLMNGHLLQMDNEEVLEQFYLKCEKLKNLYDECFEE